MGVLLVFAGDYGLSCEEGLVLSVEKSGVLFSCGERLVLSAEKGGRRVEMEAGGGNHAYVAEESVV